jgi:hypothetical protein
VAQVVQHLPSKYKALGSNPRTKLPNQANKKLKSQRHSLTHSLLFPHYRTAHRPASASFPAMGNGRRKGIMAIDFGPKRCDLRSFYSVKLFFGCKHGRITNMETMYRTFLKK